MNRQLLQCAQCYLMEFGWSVFPLRIDAKGKNPAIKWKPLQTRHPTADELQVEFAIPGINGVAIIFGAVSGHLGSRDFDTMSAYESWAGKFPKLAKLLPTVRTQRGRHVYFLTDPMQIAELRQHRNRPDGTGALKLGDGELRVGYGCYSAAPPSKRPNGIGWTWQKRPAKPLPTVDVVRDGFYSAVQQRDRDTEETEAIEGGEKSDLMPFPSSRSSEPPPKREIGGVQRGEKGEGKWQTDDKTDDLPTDIIDLIQSTLPSSVGQRNTLVFEFCRALKGRPAYADAVPLDLKHYVRAWHQAALPRIGTKSFDATWADFVHGWKRVRVPKGVNAMSQVLALARNAGHPPESLIYETEDFRLLVALCRELQRACGGHPFFLSVRTAGGLLNIDPSTASRWLELLQDDGILRCVEKGSQSSKRASRFRYLPPV